MKCAVTNTGLPALWEEGGYSGDAGEAVIITDVVGCPLRPVYIDNHKDNICGKHALFVIEPGYFIVKVKHNMGNFRISISEVVLVTYEGDVIEKNVATFEHGRWNTLPQRGLSTAIATALEKSLCYKCREPHYYKAY